MIPVKLKLHNFMPYKGNPPELSFTGIHTACISGNNGAGKSSIIDAMTWALWGKARAGSDDELVYQGAHEMEVEFDFTINRQFYRVIRKHARPKGKSKSGQGRLDLFISQDGEKFTVISGDSKTQTEQKLVRDILHMDYTTFINSAYLRQSHADEFTRQIPSKRKEVLANILNLGIYDEYEKLAKDKAREISNEKLKTGGNIGDMEAELVQIPARQKEFEQSLKLLQEIDTIIKTREEVLKKLREKQQELLAEQSRSEQLRLNIEQHHKDLSREQKRLEQASANIENYQKLVNQREAIEEGFRHFNQTASIMETLNQKVHQLAQLKDRQNQVEKLVNKAQNDLNTEHKILETQISRFENTVNQLPTLTTELNRLMLKQKELIQLEASLEAKRQQLQKIMITITGNKAEINRLQREISEDRDKLKMLTQSAYQAVCPLCESELATPKLELVTQKYATSIDQKNDSISQIKKDIENNEAQAKSLEAEITRYETRYKQENNTLRESVARLNQSIKEAQEAKLRIAETRQKLLTIEEILITKNYALEEQQILLNINNAIQSLAYDETYYETTRQTMDKLKHFDEQKHLLDEALKLLPQEKDNLIKTQETISELKKRLETGTTIYNEILKKLNSLPAINDNLKIVENEISAFIKQREEARETQGRLKQKLDYLSDLEIKVKEKQKIMDDLNRRESLYEQLVQIFGKNGIQATLIETAIPEIEEEANRLLARMTDNRMHLTFETQQPNKKGGVQETLAILISDELGTRDYELFSGGEAFRIDFSIRIALSRLLARRAGAPLPTLIIDEGFGTQDTEGIEKLKEAINSIQEDFEKIIVITHIEELKDAFPARINVVKTVDGSTIEVS
jgi:exonuclease SbcC